MKQHKPPAKASAKARPQSPYAGKRDDAPARHGKQPQDRVSDKPWKAQPQARQTARPQAGSPAIRLTSGELVYGRHAVAAALANPDRVLRQLWLANAELAEELPIPKGLKPQIVERAALDRLVGGRDNDIVHQGIVLAAEPLAELHLRDLLTEERPGPIVVLDQVTDPHNLGAILRSAAVFGASALVTTERHAPSATGVMAKAASGALERVPVVRVVNLARALREMGEAGYWRLGLAEGGTMTIVEAASGQAKVALVLGAEGDGLRRLTKENCDALVSLTREAPAEAFTTLNVSNAAAVALFAITEGTI